MEYLDIVDEMGNPTGEIVEREYAHRHGIRHRTSHVWLLRKKQDVEILLQKRSLNKDSYPGCYDISSAGHIPAGSDFETSALRELKEELGVEATKGELHYIGKSYSTDGSGRKFMSCYQVNNFGGNYSGLSGSRSGQNQTRPVNISDGLLLSIVKSHISK